MPVDSGLINGILTTGGVGIAIAFVLLVTGIIVPGYVYKRALDEVDKRDDLVERLRAALDSERQQATEAVRAASTTNQFIEALVSLAAKDAPETHPARRRGKSRRELDEYAARVLEQPPGGGGS